jgi:LPXTG-motif cell wall-anchored protein
MKRALPLVVAVVATTLFTGTSAATAQVSSPTPSQEQPDTPGKADPPGLAKGHDKEPAGQEEAKTPTPKPSPKTKAKPSPRAKTAPKPANPGKAKGHVKDKAKGKAVGHDRTKTGVPAAPAGGRGSSNENKKITFCHVPPGNPANGHLITTSVNAITPGHTNHSGDIIPPFSFVKHGSTVTFAGQNWDAAGQAALANGCKPAASSGTISAPAAPAESRTVDAPGAGSTIGATPVGLPVGSPVEATPEKGTVTDAPMTDISTTSASADVPEDGGFVDGILPNTGGTRLAVLLAGIALVAGGALLVTRRRRTV